MPDLKKTLSLIACLAVAAVLFVFPARPASAQLATKAFSTTIVDLPAALKEAKTLSWDLVVKTARYSFANSIRTLLNQFAFDTATYIGSGSKGQKPVYFTENFDDWIGEQGQKALGHFVEDFSRLPANKDKGFIDKYGICAPNFALQVRIGLGLIDYSSASKGLTESQCNMKKIWEAGNSSYKNTWNNPDYLANLSTFSFDPTSTDVGITQLLFGKIDAEKEAQEKGATLNRTESQGWLAIDPFNGKILAAPGDDARKIKKADDLLTGNILKTSGDIFVDAANIFLNQLALTAFQKLMGNLTKRSSDTQSANNFYAQGQSGGVTEVTRKNSAILQAKFTEQADYDVLSQLTTCQSEDTAGPTNCVITQPFSQAISRHLTVADAVAQGLLNANARVGYQPNGDELSYKDGYPYRSLVILRKYRVLPVGWEIAADYMKAHPQETKDMTLGSLLDCFSATDTSFAGSNSPAWCRGLVDPHWVLKLPKMFCGMQGYGGQILKADVYAAAEQDGPLNVSVMRNNDYCADEQSCIREGANGSCQKYGYCTEEKRQWVFDTENDNSCEARNNTCQTFSREGGEDVSYLENTLDYSDCDASQVGCKRYASLPLSVNGYDKATKKVSWNKDAGQLHFNKDIAQCEANGEGCHEFIRLTDDGGSNLIGDGSFESSTCVTASLEQGDSSGGGGAAGPSGTCQLASIAAPGAALPTPNSRWYLRAPSGGVTAGIVNDKYISGNQSLYVRGQGGFYSKDGGTPSILPAGFSFEPETYYILSAYIYVESGTVRLGFGDSAAGLVQETATTGSWVPYVVRFYNPAGSTVHDFFIEGKDAGTSFYVDSVQLTKGGNESGYQDYGQANVVYEKLLPAYLESACYVGGRGDNGSEYELKADAPAECFKFARKCAASEVGCQSYTSQATGVKITGKAKIKDLCPEACVGYDTFVQQANFFNTKQAAYFIPDTARTCGAQAAGCTAFTNLDALNQGGEAVEYYSAMRACIKPEASKCGQFYTWEGSDESGYQLRVFSLNKMLNGSHEEPKSTMLAADESQVCNKAVYEKTPTEAGYNYDCREFYAQDGSVSYHLLAKTISCSDNCHPYRREATQAECRAGGGEWDGSRCLYYAIPGEGTTCSAVDAGCQEYTGNVANNTRIIFNDTFEAANLPLDGWTGAQSSATSLNPGGRSLLISGSAAKTLGAAVERNTSYSVSFVAKAAGANTTINALNFSNSANETASFDIGSQPLKADWQLYTFNLGSLDHDVTPIDENSGGRSGERLTLGFSGPVYIDQIKLTAVPNRYYLIKDSWVTPSACDQDFSGQPAAGYMLGCSQYRRADGSQATLHSFTSLCQDSAAGCEAMIDTKNSSGPKGFSASIINDTNGNGQCDAGETECISTPADSIINAVYDPSKVCDGGNKGCQRLGLASVYDGGAPTFTDVYLKNDPDRYASTVCKANAVGCTQWTAADGTTSYFKDPGEEACEWKLKPGSTNVYDWYKKGRNDLCAAAYDKTIGLGGKGSAVKQPSQWAGLCQPQQAGCSEYIDPVSKFSDNLILNPSYQKNPGQDTAEHWTRIGASDEASQTVSLMPQTLYVLKGALSQVDETGGGVGDAAPRAKIKISCPAGRTLQVLQPDNSFAAKTSIDYNDDPASSSEFYIPFSGSAANYAPVACTVTRTLLEDGTQEVYLRQAVTAYQLRQNLDRTSHNNLVNFDKGSILFNERLQSGTKKSPLTFNADATYETGIDGLPPSAAPVHNANALIKVTPDRTCSKWLDCLTYIPDPARPNDKICLDIGECQSFAADGSCAVRVGSDRKNQTNRSVPFANLSGYSKVGYAGSGTPTDLYRLSAMAQVGSSLTIPNGDFESSATALSDWTPQDNGAALVAGPKSLSQEPIQPLYRVSQSSDVKFLAPQGVNVAKIPKDGGIETTNPIDTRIDSRYVLSFYSYSRGGSLTVKVIPQDAGGRQNAPQTILTLSASDHPEQWVRRSVGFQVRSSKIKLSFEASGDTYIDDIQADISLNVRCSDPNADPASCTTPSGSGPQPQYVAPSCRLYPTENALACSYTDANQIKTQGVKGYCLESDPRNPSVCLLWYPVDRIAGDAAEEGTSVQFDSGASVYYCVDAADECTPGDQSKPRLYCKQFVKVDPKYYWTTRLANGSPWLLPNQTAGATFFPANPFFAAASLSIDFGIKGPNYSFPQLTARTVDDYFGARVLETLGSEKQVVGVDATTGKLNTFVPYYASLDNKRCPDQSRYYWNNRFDFSSILSNGSDTSMYVAKFKEGSNEESLGEWDQCDASTSIYAELNDGVCNGDPDDENEEHDGVCHFDQIRDVSSVDQCTEPGTTVCDRNNKVKCEAVQSGRTWNGKTTNKLGGGYEALCVFYCYNRIKSVNVAKDAGKPLDIIRRLFPQTDLWQTYNWVQNGEQGSYQPGANPSYGSYPSLSSMPQCPASGGVPTRPGIAEGSQVSTTDYCYIPPVVSDFKVNGHAPGTSSQPYYEYVNYAQDVTLSFMTKTDKEQGPLRTLDFDFGYYKDTNIRMSLTRGGPTSSFADIMRYQTHRYEYEAIKRVSQNATYRAISSNPLCLGSTDCYILTPTVRVTDNWGKYGQGNTDGAAKVVVRPLF